MPLMPGNVVVPVAMFVRVLILFPEMFPVAEVTIPTPPTVVLIAPDEVALYPERVLPEIVTGPVPEKLIIPITLYS